MKQLLLLVTLSITGFIAAAQEPDPYYAPPFTIIKHDVIASKSYIGRPSTVTHFQKLGDTAVEFYLYVNKEPTNYTAESGPGSHPFSHMIKVRYDAKLENRRVYNSTTLDSFKYTPSMVFYQENGDQIIVGNSKTMASCGGFGIGIERKDAQGNLVYFHKYSGSNDVTYPPILRQAADGSIVGALYFNGLGGCDMGSAACDAIYINDETWAFRLTPDGRLVASNVFGGSYGDRPHDIIIRDDNSVLVFMLNNPGDINCEASSFKGENGLMVGCMDSVGNKLWVKNYGGSKGDATNAGMAVTPDGHGGAYIATISFSSDGYIQRSPYDAIERKVGDLYDVWMLHIDASGNILYEDMLRFGYANPVALTRHSDGTLWLGVNLPEGNFRRNLYTDSFSRHPATMILQLDTFFNVLHKRTIGDAGGQNIRSLVELPNGNMVATIRSSMSFTYNKLLQSPGFPRRLPDFGNSTIVFMEFNGITDTAHIPNMPLFNIYPNPNQGMLHINTDIAVPYTAMLHDTTGRQVHTFTFATTEHTESLQHLSNGWYTITKWYQNKIAKTWKFVLAK